MSWLDRAACRDTNPDWFFPSDGTMASAGARAALERARTLCRTCPVAAPCLDWALETHQAHGIWAGTTPEVRRALWRQRRCGPPGEAATGASDVA